jgi:hypothetical protein
VNFHSFPKKQKWTLGPQVFSRLQKRKTEQQAPPTVKRGKKDTPRYVHQGSCKQNFRKKTRTHKTNTSLRTQRFDQNRFTTSWAEQSHTPTCSALGGYVDLTLVICENLLFLPFNLC